MKTKRLEIHRPSSEDHHRLVELRNSNREFFFSDDLVTYENHLLWYKEILQDSSQDFLVAYLQTSHELVGTVGLANLNMVHHNCEYGRLLIDPKFRHQGYGSELLTLALILGFKYWKMHMIYGLILAENLVALRMVSKFGFDIDSVLIDWIHKGTEFRKVRMVQITIDSFIDQFGEDFR